MDSPNPFKTKEFLDLKAEWDKKLKDSGFADVEDDQDRLLHWSSDVYARRPEYDQSKAEYYRAAGKFRYDHKFDNKFDEIIWSLHAEGHSIRDIRKLLASRKPRGIKVCRDKVQKALQRLAKIMVENARVQLEQD